MLTVLAVVAVIIFVIGIILALGTNGGLGPSMVVAGILLLLIWSAIPAKARDLGQWEGGDPVIHEWYKTLERPDVPGSICCTEADAYFADEVHVRDGKTFATITDDRPDAPLGRPHVPTGTEFEVPKEKLKWDRGNPTGHNVLFVSTSGFGAGQGPVPTIEALPARPIESTLGTSRRHSEGIGTANRPDGRLWSSPRFCRSTGTPCRLRVPPSSDQVASPLYPPCLFN